MRRYGCIVADPPWPYETSAALVGRGGKGTVGALRAMKDYVQVGVKQHYGVLTVEQIANLDVGRISAFDAHLYLWTTNAFMEEAHQVARRWGFVPKTILTWVKEKKDGTWPSMKTGHHFRGASEHIVFCQRGTLPKKGPPRPTVYWHPRLSHSEKPQLFFDLAVEKSPGPYIELFARKVRRGWFRWGNEVVSTERL